jgi:starvation-inducible DNA-binding protein
MAKKPAATKAKTSKPADTMAIGLNAATRAKIVAILNARLADAFTLYSRARAFHWNVTGRNFASDHALFETEYEALDDTIDEIAERARALGGKVKARLADYAALSKIGDVDSTAMTAEAMIRSMLDGHEAVIRQLREDVETVDDLDDEGTADFLTGLLEAHEKRAWMLRSHLDG